MFADGKKAGELNNRGVFFLKRFERLGEMGDIEKAISNLEDAVQLTPDGHAEKPGRLSNLGSSYLRRFERSGDLEDIDRAISHHQKAVESTPSGHADLPGRFNNLGNSYSCRFRRSQFFPDVQNSIVSYRRAAAANGAPSIRLGSAKLAAKLSSTFNDSHCLMDFSIAISLLSEVAGLEQTIHRRHTNLHGHSDLVRSAVAIALHYNRADRALEWLEQGRCLVWSQLNQLRTSIDNLHLMKPSLAKRFITVASILESYGTRSVSSIPSSHATLAEDIRLQDDTRNHTLYATEYRQLLNEIRGLPGFDSFLQPLNAANILSSLPSDGPVIIFNLHETRCDALAVIAGRVEPLDIPLKNFSLVKAENLQKVLQFDLLKQRDAEDQDRGLRHVQHNPSSMSFVLKELWYELVGPILEALGYSVRR